MSNGYNSRRIQKALFAKNKFVKKLLTKKKLLAVLGGVFVGATNGLLGAGGGMLVVPLFTQILHVEPKKSHATAVLTILPISCMSAVGYIASGIVEIKPLLFVMIGSILGGLIGTFLLCKLKVFWVELLFIILMIVAGIMLILKN